MATSVEMPKPGNTVEECELTAWLKHKGDPVASGDVIAEVETDKASFEVTAPADGIMLEAFFDEGALVPVYTPICVIGGPGESAESFRPLGGVGAAARGAAPAGRAGSAPDIAATPSPPASPGRPARPTPGRQTRPASRASRERRADGSPALQLRYPTGQPPRRWPHSVRERAGSPATTTSGPVRRPAAGRAAGSSSRICALCPVWCRGPSRCRVRRPQRSPRCASGSRGGSGSR